MTLPRDATETHAAEAPEDDIQEMYRRARRAFETIEHWSQEQVDEMVAAVGWEWQKEANARAVAALAVEEGKIGVYEDKVNKVRNKVRGTLWDFRGAKTCGLVREDPDRGLKIYAKPIGVVANVVPMTNPEGTVCTIGLSLLKTRNAMICSPHPRTRRTSFETVEIGRRALARIGAPPDLFQCIRNPSNEKTQELMRHVDFVVATGGAALVKVVYAAGKPAHTVGAGNVVSIVDETADLVAAAKKIVRSKTANNSTSCSSENAVAIHEDVYDRMMEALRAEGGYLCTTEERERLRTTLWPDGRTLNRDVIGRAVEVIAGAAGITIPAGTRFLMVLGEQIGPEDRFSGEKLSLVLTVWRWRDFDEMLDRLDRILQFSGIGHSASIHTARADRMEQLALRAKVGRVICNMPHVMNSGGWTCGQPWTESLGCGTWAGNMTSDNINWRHFLNYTWLAVPVQEYVPTDEDLFGDYLKKWGAT
ncbi:MAG: aldehyde dehydrogenase family protein [Armatimonadota bacterium]|nr:aldehyde dehydrogenase family protein [Armatimonadota bacterium]